MIVKEIELLTEGQTINGRVFQKYEADCLKIFKENPNIILIFFASFENDSKLHFIIPLRRTTKPGLV